MKLVKGKKSEYYIDILKIFPHISYRDWDLFEVIDSVPSEEFSHKLI